MDALLLRPHLVQSEIRFDSASGGLLFVFVPDRMLLSDGQIVPRGAGTNNASAPELAFDAIASGLQTLVFSADPFRSFLTRYGSTVPAAGGGFQIELDFLSLSIVGVTGQSSGQLIGSALLVADDLSVHATAPVGSVVPIGADVELLDGATFGAGLTAADFSFTLVGQIDLAVPEPSVASLLGLGLAGLSLHARRTTGRSIKGHAPMNIRN